MNWPDIPAVEVRGVSGAYAADLACCPLCGGVHDALAFAEWWSEMCVLPWNRYFHAPCPTTGETVLVVTADRSKMPRSLLK